ncbi:MAG: glycyl-radical enzyme activating protein [Clostridia bacterium]|nr:glycyl-radical enzyme activating protein [Clostridia bacterium]
MLTATIFDIQRGSYVDGPGIRTTVFFKGCNLKCKWCHNPEGISKGIQKLFYKDKCVGCGKCARICPYNQKDCTLCGKCVLYCPSYALEICGAEYTISELFEIIIKDKSYYESSNGGVTFSGGECMLQIDFLTEILKICKKANINTAVDTAGNVPYEYFEKIIPYTDTFLYDIKCISEDLHEKFTGVSNATIISNLKKLSKSFKGKIVVRIPLIGGFNDEDSEIFKIKDFMLQINVSNVEVLPYHKMGLHKYEALNMQSAEFYTPNKEIIDSFKKLNK